MQKFKYKFDSILKVKENFKKQAMKEVAKVGKEIEEKIARRDKLILELAKCKKKSKKTVMKISELQFIESHIFFLSKKIQFAEGEISRLKLVLKMRQSELLEKTKESKIFHKLKESKLVTHMQEEKREESQILDELATQKMSRN